MQYQTRSEQLKRTLGERPVFYFDTQRHLPSYVEVRSLLGLSVARPVIYLKQQRGRQQARRNAVSPVVSTVQLCEVIVSKQLPAHRGQQAVETPTPHVVYIQPVGFPKASLLRPLSQHSALPYA